MDLIAETLAETGTPPLNDLDLEAATHALSDEDLRALDDLGSTSEVVSRMLGKISEDTTTQLERTTEMMSSAITSTQITAGPERPKSGQGIAELRKQLGACKQDDRLSWSYNYKIKRELGRGGQGIVYLTECLDENNLPKALKVFSPVPYRNVDSYYEDMERMGHVASLVYSMQVDNLALVERFAYHRGICVMIMRWIDGFDLAALIQPSVMEKLQGRIDAVRLKHLNNVVVTNRNTIQARLMPGMAVNIAEKCLRALDALHSQGIVHGDIKPSNIMLDVYGSIRMVDIGSAFQLNEPPTRYTWTPRYAPPEIFEGDPWTPQGDLASLGYVLIELLSGQPAILGPDEESHATRLLGTEWDRQLLGEKLRLPHRLGELIPGQFLKCDRLVNFLRRLIDPDPDKRFANAEEALIGPDGTYQFFQDLARVDLAAPFSQEIKNWIKDVTKLRQEAVTDSLSGDRA